jgi:hypothetical protein
MSALVHAQPRYFLCAREAWEYAGIRCAIIASPMGGWNGYVQLPWGHPWRTRQWLEVPLGGCTWGPDPDGWVGFDTGHAGDAWHPDDDTPPRAPSWWPQQGPWPPEEAAAASAMVERIRTARLMMAAAFGQPLWTLPRLREKVNAWALAVATGHSQRPWLGA